MTELGPSRTVRRKPVDSLVRRRPYEKDKKKYAHVQQSAVTEPFPYQNVHVVVCQFRKEEMEIRRKSLNPLSDNFSDLLAPLGSDVKVFVVKQYECVFTLRNNPMYVNLVSHVKSRGNPNPVTTCVAFGCVNGLDKRSALKFVGIAATDNEAWPGSETMDIGTVVVRGACTCTNTGPNNIQAFCSVYFDESPYHIIDQRGQFVNLMHIEGSPGEPRKVNAGNQKFVPALFTMSTGDAVAMVVNIQREINEKFETEFKKDNKFTKMGTYEDMFKELVEQTMLGRPRTFPLRNVMACHFYYLMLVHADDAITIQKIVKKIYSVLIEPMEKMRAAFYQSIGETIKAAFFSIFKEDVLALTKADNYDDVDDYEEEEGEPRERKYEEEDDRRARQEQRRRSKPSSSSDPVGEYKKKLLVKFAELVQMMSGELRTWIQEHRIGRALTEAEPGSCFWLDVSVGGADV